MKKRIIIFDDENHIIFLLKTFFSKLNYEVFSYSSPLDFKCLDNPEEPCRLDGNKCCTDAIITDFNMPVINGLQLIESLRNKNCRVRKIALISGLIQEIPQWDKLSSDPQIRFFQKPFALSEIKKWLEEPDNG